jgi:AcrR family transcriptional regulator
VDTRTRILHAAVDVLNEHGLAELTQTRVARELGLRQSHVTYHFHTRGDLLRAAIESGCERIAGRIDGARAAEPDSLESMRETLAKMLTDRSHSRFMTAMTVASEELPELKRWLSRFHQQNLDRLKQRFAALGVRPAADDLQLFHAAVAGAIHLDLGEGTPISQRRARHTIRLAFDRLVADSAPGKDRPR